MRKSALVLPFSKREVPPGPRNAHCWAPNRLTLGSSMLEGYALKNLSWIARLYVRGVESHEGDGSK